MNGRDSELDAQLRALHDAPVGALPRSGSEIRRAARRREYLNRVVATVGSFAVVTAVVAFGPWWRATETPLPTGESPTVTSTTAMSPVPMPWADLSTYHPALVERISVAGGGVQVTLTDAVYTPLLDVDSFVLDPKPGAKPRNLMLAPGAGLYVAVNNISGSCGDASVSCDSTTGFAKVPLQWMASYVDSGLPESSEFWYALDGAGRISVLFQVYRP